MFFSARLAFHEDASERAEILYVSSTPMANFRKFATACPVHWVLLHRAKIPPLVLGIFQAILAVNVSFLVGWQM